MCKKKILAALCVALMFAILAPAANAIVYDIQKEIALYGNLNQNSMQQYWDPNKGMNVGCGPTAAVNSFVYLQNKYNSTYGNTLVPPQGADQDGDGDVDFYDDQMTVGIALGAPNYMNTLANKTTFHDDFIWGKWQYLETVAPGKTVYAAQDWWAWNNQSRPQPAWVSSQYPTWDFLYEELKHCEDVEILLTWTDGGHYLTLTSFHWDDANNNQIIEPTENAWIDYIDPCTGLQGQCSIWHSGGYIETNYNGYEPWISMAVKESVPEPSTWLMLLLAGVCCVALRRRMLLLL